MKEHIGEAFTGVVSSITSFGMFVELENTVEGLIRLSSMSDDYYNYNEKLYCLIGERTGKVYRIGDRVEVVVTNASPETRQIDFVLLDDAEDMDYYFGENVDSNNKNTQKRGNGQKEYHNKKAK